MQTSFPKYGTCKMANARVPHIMDSSDETKKWWKTVDPVDSRPHHIEQVMLRKVDGTWEISPREKARLLATNISDVSGTHPVAADAARLRKKLARLEGRTFLIGGTSGGNSKVQTGQSTRG